MRATKQFRELATTELQKKLEEFKKELLKMNAQVASGASVENPGKIRQTKKNIARINTILKQGGVKSA